MAEASKTADLLDRERESNVELVVRCVDEEGHGLEARSRVRIDLDDVNDNAPIFEQTRYLVREFAVRAGNAYIRYDTFCKCRLLQKMNGGESEELSIRNHANYLIIYVTFIINC